jgi:hypothetical protein
MSDIPFYLYCITIAQHCPFFLIFLGFAGYMFIGIHIVVPVCTWLREREQTRLANPAYALREAARRAVIDKKLSAFVEKNPKRHRAMMARKLGLSP